MGAHVRKSVMIPSGFAVAASLIGLAAVSSGPSSALPGGFAPEVVSQVAARIIAAEIPREYERKKDWGKTKEITTGLHSNGNFFKFDIHREPSEVNHGVWKQYKLTLIDPDKNLDVQIQNLRTLENGHITLTLFVVAKVHGWAQTTVYDRGVHLIGLEAEG